MRMSTTGIELRTRSSWLREVVELVSSMRFSIALLTAICVASVIGTVIPQNESHGNYINQLGPVWADVFAIAGLTKVYSAWWFLWMLVLLVLSTGLCVARHTPGILVDLRDYKESLREQSLQAFHFKASEHTKETPLAAQRRVSGYLTAAGWRIKVKARPQGTMLAAQRGSANKLGYIATHAAIVLICLGGLLDGDLSVQAQMAWQGKSIYTGGGTVQGVGGTHRLNARTSAFRANLRVVEGSHASTAVINLGDGVVLQQLPFEVELRKFGIDYHSTGMPRQFSSDIVIHDHESGQVTAATVKVNQPAFYRGVAIYQSSFEDGGSRLILEAIPLESGREPFALEGHVGGSMLLPGVSGDAQRFTVEFTGLRVINVENLAATGEGKHVDRQKVLRNVGPSVSYKLRDAAGQAIEYHNYMLPIDFEGRSVFLLGVRGAPDLPYRYLRIPADDTGGMAGWVRLRQALSDPVLRHEAAARYAAHGAKVNGPGVEASLESAAGRLLDAFAGADARQQNHRAAGLLAISDLLDPVAQDRRGPASESALRVLAGGLFELLNLTRERAGLAPLVFKGGVPSFMQEAVLALSDSFLYPAPLALALTDFEQVQASVFQVTRAPGKTLVYLGAVLLAAGVFAMLYVRERRLWVWLAANPQSGTLVTFALSTTRRNLDAEAEFERLKSMLFPLRSQVGGPFPRV